MNKPDAAEFDHDLLVIRVGQLAHVISMIDSLLHLMVRFETFVALQAMFAYRKGRVRYAGPEVPTVVRLKISLKIDS